jgi:hypothetical protein
MTAAWVKVGICRMGDNDVGRFADQAPRSKRGLTGSRWGYAGSVPRLAFAAPCQTFGESQIDTLFSRHRSIDLLAFFRARAPLAPSGAGVELSHVDGG